MFVLTKIGEDNEKFVLIPNKKVYTIGRLSTDLMLSDDLSISRTHVRISLPSAGSGEPLTVIDLGSRYGTFINQDIQLNKKMQAKTPIPLQVGDKIRLGALKNVWQLAQLQLVTTPSSLARPEMEELQQLLQPLGGALLPTWTKECSHLTMDSVAVTVKLLHALLDNKPIVNVSFWREFSKAAHRVHIFEDWPKPEDFPPAASQDMPSIKWDPDRTRLFARKTFVFCNRKHFDVYGPVVQKAGGACKDLNSGVRRQFLTKNDVVVIQYVPSTQSQATETIHSVQDILEQVGRRLIPDYEIGLAILHCSTAKFCNPSHKIIDNSLPTTESMNSSILIPNTERTQTEPNTNKGTELIISESEIYAPSVASEKQETEPQSEADPAPSKPVEKSKSMLTLRKRNNVMFLDSSDEDSKATEPSSSKKTKPLNEAKPKQKRKLPITVDSSDEDEQLRKITKTLPGDKSKQNHNQTSVNKAAEKKESSIAVANKRESTQSRKMGKQPEKPTRRSPRGKQLPEANKVAVPQIDEDSEEEQELFPFKSKATAKAKLTVPLIDEDSDEEEAPFQFQKKTPATGTRAPFKPTESNIPTTSKSADKTKVNPPARISVRNFLEKSQNPVVASQVACDAPVASQPRKRLRLERLNESDSDDNENLFNFAGNKKAKNSVVSDNESDDGGMFNFKSATQKEKNNRERDEDQDSVSTEPYIPKPKSKYIVSKPREQAVKVNISGWLSCSGLHGDVKPKTDPDVTQTVAEPGQMEIKEEESDCDEKDAHLKWIASMKDSIQVRMCNLNITVRSHDESNALDTTDSKYSGRKNFKKFVKKLNPHPQHRTVEMKRMQLAEGMVKVL
ncbi:nibrin [Drosophila innubila]|uniref:nibrin n=1 Tax=Drosophila innubila TaxID=198719 RepID=UPI00148C05CB|nr:nibrin [Drosophila innubila]